MTRFIKSAIAALALASFAAPIALADTPKPAPVTVQYGDLDVSKAAGAEALLGRINKAARKVCGPRPMTVRYGQLDGHLACRASVVAQTVKQINEPGLTLAWQTETGAVVQTASR